MRVLSQYQYLVLKKTIKFEPQHDKTNKMLRPAIRVFACAQWVAKNLRFLHADSEALTGNCPT